MNKVDLLFLFLMFVLAVSIMVIVEVLRRGL